MTTILEQLALIEQTCKAALPSDFSSFLANGSSIPGNAVRDANGEYAYINDTETPTSILEAYRVVDADLLPRTLVPFAVDGGGNMFCLSTADRDRGAVYFLDFDMDVTSARFKTLMATSFTEFLAAVENVD
jgi:hypothetical protein